jgi:hypothetical protein
MPSIYRIVNDSFEAKSGRNGAAGCGGIEPKTLGSEGPHGVVNGPLMANSD